MGARARRRMRSGRFAGFVHTRAQACEGSGHEWYVSTSTAWLHCVRCHARYAPGVHSFNDAGGVVVSIDIVRERRLDRARSRATYRGDPPRVGPERSPLPGQHWHGGIPDAARWVR